MVAFYNAVAALSFFSNAVAALSTNAIATVHCAPKLPRVERPLMSADGIGFSFGGSHWNADGQQQNSERSAEYRARRRAMRQGSSQASSLSQKPLAPPSTASRDRSNFPTTRRLEDVCVLIFNRGQDDEGVYTQGQQGRTSVLAFENPDDAMQFAHLLLGKGFDQATPVPWSVRKLSNFCQSAGYEMAVIPRGAQPTPPSERLQEPTTQMRPRPARRDQHTVYRLWLENLLSVVPDSYDCRDDDCSVDGSFNNPGLHEDKAGLENLLSRMPDCGDDDCSVPPVPDEVDTQDEEDEEL